MAKPNYQFAKRQRDIAKKQQKEEKRQKKTTPQDTQPLDETVPPPAEDAGTV